LLRFISLATAAGVVALASAAPAAADSMVFARDNNVWISNPDGSGQFQVTLDGTAGAPYETPSEANDGTIVAVRQTPGQRRQIYRMTQSGGLLNAPINTPAPGTGAIDAKVSPDGTLVAYWFVTTVSDPICSFCVNVANRVLLTHSDRFTNADEVGTPNTGGWPSWLNNSTITLGSGSPTQWYYTLGMPEAKDWFTDSDLLGTASFNTLLDAEVAPTGDRIAVVEGDSQENIAIAKMTAGPPTKPAVAHCGLTGPTGKFVDPTWQSDGRLLAWQEDTGVWTVTVPADVDNCPMGASAYGTPALRVPGAKNPDLSPAAINPGPRPGCGNPGNPVACAGPGPGPGPVIDSAAIRKALGSSGKAGKKALVKLKISGLLRKHKFTVSFKSPAAGTLTAQLTATGAAAKRVTVLASGRHVFKKAGKAKVVVKLTSKGKKRLKHAHKLRGSLKLTFKPVGGSAISSSVSVRMKR
jgi:hypothetical protein